MLVTSPWFTCLPWEVLRVLCVMASHTPRSGLCQAGRLTPCPECFSFRRGRVASSPVTLTHMQRPDGDRQLELQIEVLGLCVSVYST